MSLFEGFEEGTCIPFSWEIDDSPTGPRLGGLPPEGVLPPYGEDTRYLMTVALRPDVEVSVFAQKPRNVFAPQTFYPRQHHNTIFLNDDVFSFIIHGLSHRSTGGRWRSGMEPRRLHYGPRQSDTCAAQFAWNDTLKGPIWNRDDVDLQQGEETVLLYRQMGEHVEAIRTGLRSAYEPSSGSKLGGRPSIAHDLPDSIACDMALKDQGYRFVMQFDDGYAGGDWPGEWPLYECGMTMVYAREKGNTIEWVYYWLD